MKEGLQHHHSPKGVLSLLPLFLSVSSECTQALTGEKSVSVIEVIFTSLILYHRGHHSPFLGGTTDESAGT